MAALPCVILSTGLYRGEVQSQQGDSHEVSTMAKSRGYGNSEEGQHLIHKGYNYAKTGNPYIVVNRRGLYTFGDFPE